MYHISTPFNASGKLWKIFILITLLLSSKQNLQAQRFNFTQYNIEHGLIQSQVRGFAQSPSRHLWIATHGGVSRFDGTQFYSLTRNDNGLADPWINALLTDARGKVFIGTRSGLSVYDGRRIQNYKVDSQKEASEVKALTKDHSGRIFALIYDRVFLFTGRDFRLVKISGAAKESVMALTSDTAGNIFAALYGIGIYNLDQNIWKLKIAFPASPEPLKITQLLVDQTRNDKLWIVTPRKLYFTRNKELVGYQNSLLDAGSNFLLCLGQDEKANLWIGTHSGAFYIEPEKTTFFHSLNGFTDNAVNQIFRDAENNIWFATEGAGVYKYDGDKTMVLDKGQGLSNEIVMGFATDRQGDLWIQSFGSTMVKLQDGKIVSVDLPVPDTVPYRLNILFNDQDGNIWIGTGGAGLWKYDGRRFVNFAYQPGKVPKVIRYMMQDQHGTIWLATPTGCYLISNGELSHLKGLDAFTNGLLEIGTDSILVTSDKGNFLITGKARQVRLIPNRQIQKTDMFCMTKYNGAVYFGTGEEGVWIWDINKDKFTNVSTKNGLYSNTIYSLISDSQGNLWAGTGRGINKINTDLTTGQFKVSGAEYSQRMIVECNQNAMFFYRNKLWVGTTKGALVFDLKPNEGKKEKPHIVLQSVKLSSSDIKDQQEHLNTPEGIQLPQNLQLAYRKNYINLGLKGIYLTNPTDVLYQYRLLGLDDSFSGPTSNASVNYQTLPPGDYVFEARALTRSGVISDNLVRFPFSIQTPFYQTVPFRGAVILFFILSGIGLQTYLHRRKTQRLQEIESLKREERLKARQQTAEDFHDDLGNKLTRISVLSDILNTKLNGEHLEEKQLIAQIKENASSLYRGTKDILWALDPKSDNLYEILNHITEFGIELFQDTDINFQCKGLDQHLGYIKFPMEYSRNISMIFKESLNNILRHAQAGHVILQVFDLDKSIEINLSDDGKGFDIQQAHKGLGLNNISFRAKRIGAGLNVNSSKGAGTSITLTINKN